MRARWFALDRALRFGFIITAAVMITVDVVAAQSARRLDIYWIDVEGGAATLIVTPQGQSVLMDAGWAGFGDRDAARIERVIREEARLSRLDYLLISHFHADHAGGLAALAKRVPVGTFVDHGELVESTRNNQELYDQYVGIAGANRRIAKPGERLPLTGVELVIVAAHSQFITAPLSDSIANPWCSEFTPQAEDRTENGKSLGYMLRVGPFEFVNLGDLSWNFQHQLSCPRNLLGRIDVFQVTHHGTRDDVLPQQLWPMAPSVAVLNNGPAKGAGRIAIETVLRSPGLEDLWSLHRAVNNDAAHNAKEQLTANLGTTEECAGDWVRARLNDDGTFTMTNSRNGYSKTYRVR